MQNHGLFSRALLAVCVAAILAARVPAPVASSSISSNPPALFFGAHPVGTASAGQPVTLTNNAGQALTITAIGIAGANSSDFNQSNNCPLSPDTFAAGASCQVSATFSPTASGPRKSAINVKDSSGDSLFILLTGVGTAAGLSPSSLSFPSQTVGTGGTPQTVTLTNLGSNPMNIWQMGLQGANAADFSKSSTCGSTLAAGSSCGITVAFTPSAAGTRSASLLISDDGGGSPQSVNLSGLGSEFLPTIVSLSPSFATAGAAAQTLTINGTNFLSSSTVTYNGAAHTATFVSSTQLTISLSATD
jgi:hypothetical protein